MVHVVPPDGRSLIVFVDDSDAGNGVELAWLCAGHLKRVALGLDSVPASTVSNIRFSPDGSHIALLVTLAHGSLIPEGLDPLHRLRGWENVHPTDDHVYDLTYLPCEDCTVQIIQLEADEYGNPIDLVVHTFSHVFVPEYGFDMVWRPADGCNLELAFAAMLHSAAGAATYLVRWKNFCHPDSTNFVFMACIDGASTELLHDKRHAMFSHRNTICTSRIEIGNDANYIFFDTLSKFGILHFDQVDDANSTKVTRADLPNFPHSPGRGRPFSFVRSSSPSRQTDSETAPRKKSAEGTRSQGILKDLNTGNPVQSRVPSPKCFYEEVTRISRISPDGTLLCSVVGISPSSISKDVRGVYTHHIEMRSSLTGRLIYRRMIVRPRSNYSKLRRIMLPFDKSGDIVQNTMCFSSDSMLVMIWDTYLTSTKVIVSKRLPIVIEARTGRLIQDFAHLSSRRMYDQLQMAPDALTLYGTRLLDERIAVDAIDILAGVVLKTVLLSKAQNCESSVSRHSIYVLAGDTIVTVSRGWVDGFWETSRGSLGCGWKAEKRASGPDEFWVDQENRSP